MNPSPRVSIIMPAYNSAKYIGPAIRSVIDQTFTDWELLLFNDGSTDETDEVVEPFLNDSRIQYIRQENLGQPKTRNKGVRMSRGNLIALLDADDLWMPAKLEKQVAIFEKYPDVGVCGTAMELIRPTGEVFAVSDRKEFYGHAAVGLVTGALAVAMSASVTRREVFEKIGFFDERFLPFSMDYDFWLRASLEYMFYNLGEKLVRYRTGHPSISQEGGDKRRSLVMNVVIPRFLREYGGSKYVKWCHVWKLHSDCYLDRASGQKRLSHKLYWLFRSLLSCPWKPASWWAVGSRLVPQKLRSLLKEMLR